MENLFVDLGKKSYDILFSDSFNGFAKAMSDINAPKKLLVVTDSNVEKLYADEVNDLLIKNGYDSKIYAFTAGEENKGMDTILGICGACIEHEMDRKSMIIALGGGGSTKIVMDDRIERVFNFKDPLEYIRRFDEILKKKDEILDILAGEKNG